MGSYSSLKIGNLAFYWKYHVPTFLTFLFEDSDYFSVPRDDDPDWFEAIGYRTEAHRSIAVLNGAGFTVEFFAEVYDELFLGLDSEYRERLESAIVEAASRELPEGELQRRIEAHLAAPPQSRLQDLRDFIEFMREGISSDFSGPRFSYPIHLNGSLLEPSIGRKMGRDGDEFTDFESLDFYIGHQAHRLPASVARVGAAFSEGWMFFYPEVLSLMYTRLLLEASPPGVPVVLDLSDIAETETEARELHSSLAFELAQKVSLYNRVFRLLTDSDEDHAQKYVKARVQALFSDADREQNPNLRGSLLEGAVAELFGSHPDLEVIEKRVSTGDEEIDLLVKNDVARGFWHGLDSPLLFVECKNWRSPVGVPELRDFEVKLQNHRPLARVGFVIAMHGFTDPCHQELRRASRDDYTIVLISSSDVQEFIEGPLHLLDWLERRIARLV